MEKKEPIILIHESNILQQTARQHNSEMDTLLPT